jgi:hypothetical protein
MLQPTSQDIKLWIIEQLVTVDKTEHTDHFRPKQNLYELSIKIK